MKKIKIVAVVSSAHTDGNGARLAKEVLKGSEKQGAEITEIFIHKEKLSFCTGCNQCIAIGRCPLLDDFEKVRSLLYDADGIVLCSPTFGGTINATMKNLFDRLGMYERCTSMLSGKYVVGLSTASQESAAKKTARELAINASSCTYNRGMISGVMGVSIMPNGISEKSDCLKKALQLGEKLVDDIKEHKVYYFQNILERIIMRRFVRPAMSSYIEKNKENATKAVYENLCQRGLL